MKVKCLVSHSVESIILTLNLVSMLRFNPLQGHRRRVPRIMRIIGQKLLPWHEWLRKGNGLGC